MKTTFEHGVHPPGHKELSADRPVEALRAPASVTIPLLQHTGAICTPMVKPRQAVALGEKIGEAGAFVSSPVHATVNGTVKKVISVTLPTGRRVPAVSVAAVGEQPDPDQLFADVLGGEWPSDEVARHDPDTIVEAVRRAGIVGLGGAAFPTHVKLKRNPKKPVDTLLVNGCECEPYLTADYRLMVEAPHAILAGALLAAHAAGATRIIVAIEDSKPAAIEAVGRAAAGTPVKVVATETKYPMGSERSVVPAVLGRRIPTRGLPLDVGVVVSNVGTVAAIARAVLRGRPLTHRIVTVSGAGIRKAKNLLVPIGTPYSDLIAYCGGLTPEAAQVVSGGPMMGFTVGNLATPVTKGTSGLTVLTWADIVRGEETACLRCGRCVDVCPLELIPARLAQAARTGDWDLARRHHIAACVECGCCSYECPAQIPIVQLVRTAKVAMRKREAA